MNSSVDVNEAPAAEQPIEPVVKEVTVPLDPSAAWELFTDRAASWWPLATHSVGGEGAVTCMFEPRVGGRLYETVRDGTQHIWGTILDWQPPTHFAMTWHPGRTPSTEQRLEAWFTPSGDGGTTVRLVHTGWERLGTAGRAERDSYGSGWDYVLNFFVEAAAS